MTITTKQKEQFLKELEINGNENFDSELVRTTELEMQIINDFGFEGIQLINDTRNGANYHNLGDFPEDCPWHYLNNLSIDKAIDAVFEPVHDMVSLEFMTDMKERCQYLYVEKTEGSWMLHYWLMVTLYDNRMYYKVLSGGEPLSGAQPNSSLQQYGWEIPEDLAIFYTVHNGFGENGNSIVYPNSNLVVMEDYIQGSGEDDEYSFEDLLEIANDGCGNTVCFFRNTEDDEMGHDVVDWDHETGELTDLFGFWIYLDDAIYNLDEIDYDEELDEEDLEDESFLEDLDVEEYNIIDFGDKFTITSTAELPANVIEKYKTIAPVALMHLWETRGLPVINDGLITFINPAEYTTVLDTWLGKHESTYIPFAVGAFGNLFYYRKLKGRNEDVCAIEPNYREIDTCAWSFREFIETYLYDEYTSDYVLREQEFKAAVKKNGMLKRDEIYMFTPSIVLGGEEKGECTEKANTKVHLQLLFDITA